MEYNFLTYEPTGRYRFASGMDMCAAIIEEAVKKPGEPIMVEGIVTPRGRMRPSQIRVNISKYFRNEEKYLRNEEIGKRYMITTTSGAKNGVIYITAIEIRK